jgi:hypothetical protein
MMFQDDLVTHPQPKSGSGFILGGKEGLEDAMPRIIFDA